jgi:hypothetical protein
LSPAPLQEISASAAGRGDSPICEDGIRCSIERRPGKASSETTYAAAPKDMGGEVLRGCAGALQRPGPAGRPAPVDNRSRRCVPMQEQMHRRLRDRCALLSDLLSHASATKSGPAATSLPRAASLTPPATGAALPF